jgi:methylmalonyl-CoA epimerase
LIKAIHHIAVVVRDLDDALKLYNELLGLTPEKIETVPGQGIKAAVLPIKGGGEIELMEPIDPESGVAKFMERRGEGIHHICFEVDDVDKELTAAEEKGYQTIDKKSRPGLAGPAGFLHPKSTKGTLVEFVQVDEKGALH